MIRRRLGYLAGGALAAVALVALIGATTGGFPSRPRFQAVGVGTAAPATAGEITTTGNVTVGSNLHLTASTKGIEHGARGTANTPFIDFHSGATDTDFDVRIIGSGGTGSSGGGTLTFHAAGTSFATTDIARQSQSNTFTGGQQTIQATTGNARLYLKDTAAALDEKAWATTSELGLWQLFTVNDAGSGVASAITANRTGTTVDSVNLTATSVQANGSTIWTAGNDGAGSGLDADTLDGISSAGFIQTDAIGTTYVAYSASVTSRTSTTTNSCDSNLTLSLPNATRDYSLRAFLNFDGNGITANGWSILPQASTGTIVVDWHAWADTNTTAANAAPTANQGASGGDMDATFNAAGVATYVTVEGNVRVTAGTAPAVCIAWAQTASNATATDLNIGSYLQLTRLN